ncbi:MAG: hypothetical protein ABFE08_06740 [Armatimonadia bacterium]
MRKTPQIPRDVFFGGSTPAAPAAAPDEPVVAGIAAPPLVPVAPVEEDKVQVTVYLSPAAAKRLEALRFHLFNEHNVKVSKSAIAEYGIANLGEDLAPIAEYFRVGER